MTPCSVCTGRPLPSGRPCICGGKGTETAEMEGLRLRVFELEAELAGVAGESGEAHIGFHEAWKKGATLHRTIRTTALRDFFNAPR